MEKPPKMKPSTYRRKRAEELAHRDFLARRLTNNPFPEGTSEHRAYTNRMRYLTMMDEDMRELFEVYGGEMPTMRSPDSVQVRPALPGGAAERPEGHGRPTLRLVAVNGQRVD